MINVRESVFETNSSACHSLTLVSDQTYKDWVAEKTIFSEDTESFIEFDKLFDICLTEATEDYEKRKGKKEPSEYDRKKLHVLEYIINHAEKESFDEAVKTLLKDHDGRILSGMVNEDGEEIGLEYSETANYENATAEDIAMELLYTFSDGLLCTEVGYYNNDDYETYHTYQEIDNVTVHAFGYYGGC